MRERCGSAKIERWTCALLLWLGASVACAAEIRGTVVLQGVSDSGRGSAIDQLPISVALLPAEGQPRIDPTPTRHAIELSGNRIDPLYLAVNRADRLEFRNPDRLYHELFALSADSRQPLELRLDRHSLDQRVLQTLDEPAEWHWFCRIHARSYARVDVLDTPYIKMIRSGQSFVFPDVPRGRWRLRVAAPGAETQWLETDALTAPPSIDIKLGLKGFTASGFGLPQVRAVDQLFPSQPGL